MADYAGDSRARRKADGSPVTDADEAAEAIILKRLAMRLPHLPVLAEEAASRDEKMVAGRTFILVDPLDGTREFLSHNGEFTVNIGLIIDAEPRAGVVYAPAFGQLWIGGATASTCEVAPGAPLPLPRVRRAIHARPAPRHGLTALVSRSHADPATEAFLAKLPIKARRAGFRPQILRGRRGPRRRLSAFRPNHGMGHGGGGRGVARGGRDRSR